MFILNNVESRARRNHAEQENPSRKSLKPNWWKGADAMRKNVFNRFNSFLPVALVFVGWLSFIMGLIIDNPEFLKITLLTTARVLPLALQILIQ